MKLTKQHEMKPIADGQRLEYRCTNCDKGYYRFAKDMERLDKHNQMPHVCNNCGHQVYFVIPYPALYYKGRVFVDWETIRGLTG